MRAVHGGPGAAAPGTGDRARGDHAGAGGAAGVLLLALLLPGEHCPEVVSDRSGDARETAGKHRSSKGEIEQVGIKGKLSNNAFHFLIDMV